MHSTIILYKIKAPTQANSVSSSKRDSNVRIGNVKCVFMCISYCFLESILLCPELAALCPPQHPKWLRCLQIQEKIRESVRISKAIIHVYSQNLMTLGHKA